MQICVISRFLTGLILCSEAGVIWSASGSGSSVSSSSHKTSAPNSLTSSGRYPSGVLLGSVVSAKGQGCDFPSPVI